MIRIDDKIHSFGAMCMGIHLQSVQINVTVWPERAFSCNCSFNEFQELSWCGAREIDMLENVVSDVPVRKRFDDPYS